AVALLISNFSEAQKKPTDKKEDKKPATITDPLLKPETYSSLSFRSIGPAVTSGRVIDIAVNPKNKNEWYIAAAAGGVWKTSNAGVTFNPIFDGQSAYSIGCVSIDPNNPNVIWVGTGENNNQRAVGYGDGVYKSEDGGKSWKNVGLTKSEHIGNISIDPNNSDIVYVAAYGPLWNLGGERGIYKTTDGGKTWKQVLNVSENTGFNEVHIDPKHNNIIYAAAHQRRRHEWTYISGGPESALYKSTDSGLTWNKLTNGLPISDMGRISFAISPVNSDVVYAIIEATEGKGFYKSTDRGASWNKQSDWSTAGNYYQEIFCDPKNVDKVYSMDTWLQVTTDGGKTFKGLGEKNKHVDNHDIYVDPKNTDHMLVGCDGGLYESFDGAETWDFKANLPITQFYRVCTDNDKPFYNIYGGTQDNNSLGGPSRTKSATGIINADWYVTVGGDGFQSRVDPTEPNIVYSEWQYGGLVRYDRKSGEAVDIKPQEKPGEPAYRFNWDAPILISNFDNKRIYFAANKVFRSDDRGNTWKVISPDITRQVDRNKIPVMGKVWGMDAVAKNQSTSIYGNITALAESPKNENIIYAGTDDGLIQTTTDGGKTWNKSPQVPSTTVSGTTIGPLVNFIMTSQHDENVAYAVLNNHRNGDFKPYLVKTTDKGKTWTSITGNLPANGSAYSMAEDHLNKNLLFCGTEFGFYFSNDGGKNWIELKSGLPEAICVKDITIQKRENDIIIATFGRGFYVIDNYSLLQNIKKEDLDKKAFIFPVKDGLVFNESTPYGHKGKSFQGASMFTANNPPIGASITYYQKDSYKSLKDKRKDAEKEKIKANKDVFYPVADSIRLEDNEEAAYTFVIITDEQGNEVRKLKQDAAKGMKKITWDGRLEITSPVSFYTPNPDNPYESADQGPVAIPGKYFAQVVKVYNAQIEILSDKVGFNLVTLQNSTLPIPDQKEMMDFNKSLGEFRRVVMGSDAYVGNMNERLKYLKAGLQKGPSNSMTLIDDLKAIETQLKDISFIMHGDASLAKREFETLPGLSGSLENVVGGTWGNSLGATNTYKEKLSEIKDKFKPVYAQISDASKKLNDLEAKAESMKLPATPGRLPKWE
ncbi:MAG TPA: glycosyl hydrolase, partial [Bacteroidia bacterium]|nr:glycosyl hydrolase [Bacteroidia bacterium]